ncbi:MAG TPA: hypothetical protein G4O03_05650 [Dehalococcoidia bacterium]|jgi:cell division protein FtsX|nr:hypothetical protein [Dehalococcoidia bacterium]
MRERVPTAVYCWVSGVVSGLGILAVLWAIIEGALRNWTAWEGPAAPSTMLLLAICGFLVAIGAMLAELKRGIKAGQ